MSGYYPILMNLEGRRCLIVGGGQVAARKAAALVEAGARVRLVAPQASDKVKALADAGEIDWIEEPFGPHHLEGAVIVIASTDNERVNREAYEEAVARSIPVNVVDQPELCTFIVPSVVRRGDLVVAVSTSGRSPAVSKMVRKKLENEFGEEWAAFLAMMGGAREKAMNSIPDQKDREKAFTRLAQSDLLDLIRRGDMRGARNLVEEIVGS